MLRILNYLIGRSRRADSYLGSDRTGRHRRLRSSAGWPAGRRSRRGTQKLKKPPYQPPRQAFPIVWPMLYADIAVISAATLDELERHGPAPERRAYIVALVANLVLNGSWSWLFFNRRRLGTSAIAAGVLTASSADLTRRADRRAGRQGRPARRLSGVVRVRHGAVHPHLGAQPPLRNSHATSSRSPARSSNRRCRSPASASAPRNRTTSAGR